MIFLDTGYFKGLMDVKDRNHKAALKIKNYLDHSKETTVINTTVLVETLNKSVKTGIFADRIYEDIRSKNQIIQLTTEDYLESFAINRWYGNSINYSDCTIIRSMMVSAIRDIVTFDSDFEKVSGFNIISSI